MKVAAFIRGLRRDSIWAPDEIIELQRRVIRELIARQARQ